MRAVREARDDWEAEKLSQFKKDLEFKAFLAECEREEWMLEVQARKGRALAPRPPVPSLASSGAPLATGAAVFIARNGNEAPVSSYAQTPTPAIKGSRGSRPATATGEVRWALEDEVAKPPEGHPRSASSRRRVPALVVPRPVLSASGGLVAAGQEAPTVAHLFVKREPLSASERPGVRHAGGGGFAAYSPHPRATYEEVLSDPLSSTPSLNSSSSSSSSSSYSPSSSRSPRNGSNGRKKGGAAPRGRRKKKPSASPPSSSSPKRSEEYKARLAEVKLAKAKAEAKAKAQVLSAAMREALIQRGLPVPPEASPFLTGSSEESLPMIPSPPEEPAEAAPPPPPAPSSPPKKSPNTSPAKTRTVNLHPPQHPLAAMWVPAPDPERTLPPEAEREVSRQLRIAFHDIHKSRAANMDFFRPTKAPEMSVAGGFAMNRSASTVGGSSPRGPRGTVLRRVLPPAPIPTPTPTEPPKPYIPQAARKIPSILKRK